MVRIYILLLLGFLSCPVFSQRWKLTRYEAMVGIATTNYFGDIGGVSGVNNWYGLKDIQLLRTRPGIYGGARYKITREVSIKLNLVTTVFSGADADSSKGRQYKFNTFGFEHSVQFEYSVINEDRRRTSFAIFNRRGMYNNFLKTGIYGFGGMGGLVYYTSVTGKKYKTDIFRNGTHYTGVVFGGAGIKIILSNKMAMGVDFGVRYALTDLLDGATAKTSHFNDMYYFGVFNVIYRIKTSRKGYPILFRRY